MLATRRSLLGAAALAAACRKRLSPEEQVRRAIGAAERAVTGKDLSAFGRFVAADYRDGEQNDRAAVMAMMHLQFARNPAIHLLVRVASVEITAAREASATVFAAMASVPIPGPEELPRLAADLYRFDVRLRDDGGGRWQVTSAAWQPADVRALVGGP